MNARVKELFTDLNRISKDRLHVIVMALESFAATRAAQAAAGLAYYAFFFPVSVASSSYHRRKLLFG